MLYIKDAQGTVQQIGARLEEAAAASRFGVMGVHNLKEKMASKGIGFGPQCLIYEVCNPEQAKRVLEADMSISTVLPCRISVYEANGGVKVATMLPTAMLALFERDDLEPVAREVEQTIVKIIDAACGGVRA